MEDITRKDGITYTRRKKRDVIPSKTQYQETLKRLSEEHQLTTLIALRLGAELGMSRIEIVNAEVQNIDRKHTRGLWVEVAKHVRRGGTYKMRSREIPINTSLYSLLLNYIDRDTKYIIKRERPKKRITKQIQQQHINWLYEKSNIQWSSHKSRHYFKNAIKDWMRKNRCMDPELIRHYMGHPPLDAHTQYGDFSWDYKTEIIDQVFK